MSLEKGGGIKAVTTAFEIIECIKELNGAGVTELSKTLNKPKSTVHDYLRSLEEIGYVLNVDGEYTLSTRFLEYGGYVRQNMDLYRIASPEIQRLAVNTGEHANLMVEENGYGVFLYKATGEKAVQLDTYVGMRVPLQTTSMGKAILAQMPRDRVFEILEQVGMPSVTSRTLSSPDKLLDELSEIRERGYALDDQERVEGMRCVGASLTKTDGTILGAISVSGPSTRFEGETLEAEIPQRVLSTANVIEVNYEYS